MYRSWSSDPLCIISLSRALFLAWRPPISLLKGCRLHYVDDPSFSNFRDWRTREAIRNLKARSGGCAAFCCGPQRPLLFVHKEILISLLVHIIIVEM
jgi:hypothetical protein